MICPPRWSGRKGEVILLEILRGLDGAVLLWIQEAVRCELLNPLISVYTRLGNAGVMWIALSLAMLCFRKTRKAGALSLLAMLFGLLCTNVALKHLVARPRPWLTVEGLHFLVVEKDPNSFPSGHTCAAFAAAGVWFRTLPWRWARWTAVVLAIFMGLSRLYVGVHFPSDVAAGCLVGLFCAWLAWTVYRQAEKHYGPLRWLES